MPGKSKRSRGDEDEDVEMAVCSDARTIESAENIPSRVSKKTGVEEKAQKRNKREKNPQQEREESSPTYSTSGNVQDGADNSEEDDSDKDEADVQEDEDDKVQRIFQPGVDEVQEDEELDYDPTAYELYAKCELEWPCLSLDIIRDPNLGLCRTRYPLECSLVAGTQAGDGGENRLYVMHWSKLHKNRAEDSEDEDSEEDDEEEASDGEEDEEEDEDDEPEMRFRSTPHPCGVNRVRAMPQSGSLVSTWGDDGVVRMWSVGADVEKLQQKSSSSSSDITGGKSEGGTSSKQATSIEQVFAYTGHNGVEGFAMDWSPSVQGRFVSGDNAGSLKLWNPCEGGWKVDDICSLQQNSSSSSTTTTTVEDVQWRQKGSQDCFASCGSDGFVRVWDILSANNLGKSKPSLEIKAHEQDVNVLAWNPLAEFQLLTGSDDGSFKVYDIRHATDHMAHFEYHQGPITSVAWHPQDETGLAVASADNTLTLWDMAVEEDEDAEGGDEFENADEFPPQLLFVHQGQTDIMECRLHPQIPGLVVSTAADGLNVFKACKQCNF